MVSHVSNEELVNLRAYYRILDDIILFAPTMSIKGTETSFFLIGHIALSFDFFKVGLRLSILALV